MWFQSRVGSGDQETPPPRRVGDTPRCHEGPGTPGESGSTRVSGSNWFPREQQGGRPSGPVQRQALGRGVPEPSGTCPTALHGVATVARTARPPGPMSQPHKAGE